jgi:hypothetical protein
MSGRRPIRNRTTLAVVAAGLWAGLTPWLQGSPADSLRFAILGDRTGETQAGVYEQVWKEAAAGHPPFVVTTGDKIYR